MNWNIRRRGNLLEVYIMIEHEYKYQAHKSDIESIQSELKNKQSVVQIS